MRNYIIMILICVGSIATAKSKKPDPTWWCYVGMDGNKDVTAVCVRGSQACEISIAQQEFVDSPQCFGRAKAFAFTITHKNSGVLEIEATPDLRSCKAISEQMAVDSPDVVVGPCVLTP